MRRSSAQPVLAENLIRPGGSDYPCTRRTTTGGGPIAAGTSARPAPTTPSRTSHRSGSSVGLSSAVSSTSTSELDKAQVGTGGRVMQPHSWSARIQVVKGENKTRAFAARRLRRPFSDQPSGQRRPGQKEWANQRQRGHYA